MDAARMREILKMEYGICSDKEFNAAVSKSAGIDLGIFTMPLEKRKECELESRESRLLYGYA